MHIFHKTNFVIKLLGFFFFPRFKLLGSNHVKVVTEKKK